MMNVTNKIYIYTDENFTEEAKEGIKEKLKSFDRNNVSFCYSLITFYSLSSLVLIFHIVL